MSERAAVVAAILVGVHDICQWHWGAYASGDNDDVVLYEDDNVIWKLQEQLPSFDAEPYFDVSISVCGGG